MGKAIDLTGQRFGRWTVIERAGTKNHGHVSWLCTCACGNSKIVDGRYLRQGISRSCGCLMRESVSHRMTIHGKTKSKLFYIWQGMKNRCYNAKTEAFKFYGGRGIIVCDEWKTSFVDFQTWALRNGYVEGLTIDRIDVNGNYEPTNCRWVTIQEQSLNRRSSLSLEYRGEKKILTEWAKSLSIKQSTLRERLCRGWSVEDALTTPVGQKRKNP